MPFVHLFRPLIRPRATPPTSFPLVMELSATSLQFTGTQGGSVPTAQTITVSSSGNTPPALAGPTVGTITDPDDIVDTAVITGAGPWLLTVTPKLHASAGNYSASVQITDANATNSPRTVTVQETVQASGGSTTNIAAALWSDNTTGTAPVSSGFPLRQGDLTDQMVTDRKVAVFVGGVEQQVYVEALRGRFPDGSVRSVLIQLSANIPSTTAGVACEVRLGTARSTVDLSLTPVTQAVYQAYRVIVPTDPAYLCATWCTFQPMLPAAQENAANVAYFGTLFDSRFEALKANEQNAGNYQSTYESGLALIARWQATGQTKYLFNALRRGRGLLNYSLPTNGTTFYNPNPNPEGITASSGPGLPSEAHSQRYLTFASCYLLSGWAPLRNVVAICHQWGSRNRSSQAIATGTNGWVHGNYYGRFNVMATWAFCAATMIDCTEQFNYPGGYGNARVHNYPTEIPWILDAYDAAAFDLGDYRDGMRGSRDTATATGSTPQPGAVPHFQWAIVCNFMLFYYLNVKADTRIPGWLNTNASAMWDNNVLALSSGDVGFGVASFGHSYWMTSIAGSTPKEPWTMPMWAAVLAFLKHQFPAETKWATYYGIAIDPDNVKPSPGGGFLVWGWKHVGELYGYQMAAPYLDQQGTPAGLPATIRAPTQY